MSKVDKLGPPPRGGSFVPFSGLPEASGPALRKMLRAKKEKSDAAVGPAAPIAAVFVALQRTIRPTLFCATFPERQVASPVIATV